MMKRERIGFLCFFLLLAVMLVCSSCANPRLATTIALTRTQGEVEIIDRRGKDVSLKENLRIFDGYIMGTHTSSYAWMDLDQARLVKLDQDSQIGIQKEKKKLEIVVQSGSLFFHVARPLEEDESLDIRTSSMMVGIRGTCGWVEVSTDGEIMRVYLLEGRVECRAGEGEEMAAVEAGEMASMSRDGEITVSTFTLQDTPGFVLEEIQENEELGSDVQDALHLSDEELQDLLNRDSSDNLNAAGNLQQDASNPPEILEALEQYRAVLYEGDISRYFPDSEPSGVYWYALVKLQTDDKVPTLLLSQEDINYMEDIRVFQYDPVSRILHQPEETLRVGAAPVGGYRGFLSLQRDGNGLELETRSSGTGDVWVYRVTLEGDALNHELLWEGYVLERESLVNDEVSDSFLAEEIPWYDIADSRALDNWRADGGNRQGVPDSGGASAEGTTLPASQAGNAETEDSETMPSETTLPETSAAETISAMPWVGYGVTGTFNFYTHDQVVALQGMPDPNGSGGSEIYRLIVLDTPQMMTFPSADATSELRAGLVKFISVESDALDAYAGQHLSFCIYSDASYWRSDTSLPIGAPYTTHVSLVD